MKTNKIRQYITTKLKTLNYKVYYRQASDMATFPYIVFDLDSYKAQSCIAYDFEVNVWGEGSVAQLEDLADEIESLFEDDMNLSENGLLTFCWRDRSNLDDPNKDLKRIMIKFDMGYYK